MDRSGSLLSLAASLDSLVGLSRSLGTLAARLRRGTDLAENMAAWNHCLNRSVARLTFLLLWPETRVRAMLRTGVEAEAGIGAEAETRIGAEIEARIGAGMGIGAEIGAGIGAGVEAGINLGRIRLRL